MRKVARPDPPASFADLAEKEFDKVVAHRDDPTTTKSFTFGVYKLDEVKALLHQIFHGKCAYCENHYAQAQPMDVEHFRPKGAVAEDETHPGYWWLAMKWDNLLPSCTDCNRKRKQTVPKGDVRQVTLLGLTGFSNSERLNAGKKDSFPLLDGAVRTPDRATEADRTTARSRLAERLSPDLRAEQALLLNPCDEDPSDHLTYHFGLPNTDPAPDATPVSFILAVQPDAPELAEFIGADGLSLKGAVSIRVYGLNRLDLVQARTEVLRRLEFLKSIGIRLFALSQELDEAAAKQEVGSQLERLLTTAAGTTRTLGEDTIREIARMAGDDQPFCSMVRAWRIQFIGEIEKLSFS